MSGSLCFALLWTLIGAAQLCTSLEEAPASTSILPSIHEDPTPQIRYQPLPSLREQAEIQEKWRTQRLETIPSLLKKYGVDAWLVRFNRFTAKSTMLMALQSLLDEPARAR